MRSSKMLNWMIGGLLFVVGWLAGLEMATIRGVGAQSTATQPGTTQKTLMHVFAYTPLDGATQADFDAFRKATGDMVGKIPGLRKVWVGKLREPLPQETTTRIYGVAMEFDDAAALNVYANHPVHTEWVKVYDRVRVRGTTTLDILGE